MLSSYRTSIITDSLRSWLCAEFRRKTDRLRYRGLQHQPSQSQQLPPSVISMSVLCGQWYHLRVQSPFHYRFGPFTQRDNVSVGSFRLSLKIGERETSKVSGMKPRPRCHTVSNSLTKHTFQYPFLAKELNDIHTLLRYSYCAITHSKSADFTSLTSQVDKQTSRAYFS